MGYTTSGSYGHTVGGGIGMGYVRTAEGVTQEFLLKGRYEIVVNGTPVPARIHVKAPYDPSRSKLLL